MADNVINTMRCPFRTDKNGDFCECYGEKCMAYHEYEPYIPFFNNDPKYPIPKDVVNRICRRLSPPIIGPCA